MSASSKRQGRANAADPRQVRAMERLEKRREERWADALRSTMATPAGRAFVWALIRRAGVFESPFDPHGSVQSFKIGRGDMGREIMGEVLRLAPEEWLTMEAEARRVDALEQQTAEAAQAATAADGEGQEG